MSIPIAFDYRPLMAKWTIVSTPDGEELLQCEPWTGRLGEKSLDPWKLRAEFLRLKPGNTKALAMFLNECGAWCSPHDPQTHWDTRPIPESWNPKDIWARRELFLKGPMNPIEWLSNPGTAIVATATQHKFPFQVCLVSGCEYAMRMSITFDLLDDVKFKLCALEDCRAPFRKKDPRKRYCTNKCAHTADMRSRRSKVDQPIEDAS